MLHHITEESEGFRLILSLYLLRLSFYTRTIQPSVEILGAGEEEEEEEEEKEEEEGEVEEKKG